LTPDPFLTPFQIIIQIKLFKDNCPFINNNMKLKVYKFKVTDKELNRITKYHFSTEILKELGIKKTSVYDIIKNKEKKRIKYEKYDIESIREPYIEYN